MKKKILCCVVALMLVGLLAGCAGGGDGETLIMATSADFPPFQYYEGDQIVGLDVDIAKEIVYRLGKNLEIEDMAFDSIIGHLQAERADFAMAAMTHTEARAEMVDFSITYYTGQQVIIVAYDNDFIHGPEDLEGVNIGVQMGTTGDSLASWDFPEEYIFRYTRGMEAIQALIQGSVDAVIIDDRPAREFVANVPGLRILDTEFADENYAIAFPKGSPLVERFNEIIVEMKEDGTFQEIVDRYVGRGTD